MLVNKSNLSNLFISLKAMFNNAFDAAPTTWEKIAMLVPSSTSQNDYAWLSAFPKMVRWVGSKAVKNLKGFKYSILNENFEATIEVDRNDIEDDNLGIYSTQAKGAGMSAKQLPDEIVYEVVNGGFTTLCFDGQYFFDTDHPVIQDGRVVSVSNKSDKALSAESVAAAEASLGVGSMAMMEFKDDEGRSLNVKPNILLVPPALMFTANLLMTTDRLEDGKANPFKGAYEVVVEPRLRSRTAWFLLDTTKPVRPFIYQERKKAVLVEQTDPQSDKVFDTRLFKFGAEARAAGGYGFWQTAFGSTGTVA